MHMVVAVLSLTSLISTHCIQRSYFCQDGYFPCNGSDVCVPRESICDGKKDCENGSDETDCKDENKREYYNNLFRKRPDEDRHTKIKTCDMIIRPIECQCSEKSLFCNLKNFHAVPLNLSEDLQMLDLAGNKLDSIDGDHFPQLPQLHTLLLSKSEITQLSEGAFKNLTALEKLYLIGNNLESIQNNVFTTNRRLNYLDLSHNPLVLLNSFSFQGLEALTELNLRHCLLETLPDGVFDPLIRLERLSLSKNKLYSIEKKIFQNNGHLKLLSLDGNKLKYLNENSFGTIPSLKKLELRNNRIKTIASSTFDGLSSLISLDLSENPFEELSPSNFENLTCLEYIYFQDFQLCSYAPKVRICHPRSDGISSLEHLLDKVILRFSVWTMASVACIGNFFVLMSRVLLKEPNEIHSFFIKNLSLADLLMSIYLFIIASQDVIFRGKYMLYQPQWKKSWLCRFSGFLSTLSSEASVLVLAVITLDRYVSICYPLSVQRRNWTIALLYMVLVWSTAVLLAAIPLSEVAYFGENFYSNNGMCLPINIHRPYADGWEYSTFIFCGINMIAFIIIVYAYISMFFSISRSKSGLRSTQQQQDRAIVKRFAFIIGTDFICWVPIIIIKLISFTDVPIPTDLYAWIAVFFLPVNSALNPILYTLTTKLFRQRMAKMVRGYRPSSELSGISLSSFFHHRSSKKTYITTMSDNDQSFTSKSSQLSRKTSPKSGVNGFPSPQAV
ncbi:relaxin receptor 1-like [Centruroides sculpturatus]|uniref:relaxin receptor 1-like n=1 Tax=Centruroides sculpturatus TaxID=218467 RepID=UPI000C6E4E19|nr:relaxin receptor 1-like [Centruroides sculpturatus]